MIVTGRKKHTFVGANIEFMNDRTVKLSMEDYVQECIDKYSDKIRNIAAAPAKGDVFDDNLGELSSRLNNDDAEKFHDTTAKLLYL